MSLSDLACGKIWYQFSSVRSQKNWIISSLVSVIVNVCICVVVFFFFSFPNCQNICFIANANPEKEHRAFLELENEVTITNWKKAHAELFQRRIDEASPLEVMQLHLIPLVMNRDAQRLCALIEFCLLGK